MAPSLRLVISLSIISNFAVFVYSISRFETPLHMDDTAINPDFPPINSSIHSQSDSSEDSEILRAIQLLRKQPDKPALSPSNRTKRDKKKGHRVVFNDTFQTDGNQQWFRNLMSSSQSQPVRHMEAAAAAASGMSLVAVLLVLLLASAGWSQSKY